MPIPDNVKAKLKDMDPETRAAAIAYYKRNDEEEKFLAERERPTVPPQVKEALAPQQAPSPHNGEQVRSQPTNPGLISEYIRRPEVAQDVPVPMVQKYTEGLLNLKPKNNIMDEAQAKKYMAEQARENAIVDVLGEIKQVEAGYQNVVEDRGNKNSEGVLVGTNHGISASTYEKHLGRPPTVQDMKDMPLEVAQRIYRKDFIEPVIKQWEIEPTDELFPLLVDLRVNMSPRAGNKIVQRALGVEDDGVIGPKTRKALSGSKDLKRKIVVQRIKHHVDDVAENPEQVKHLAGWLKRSIGFLV